MDKATQRMENGKKMFLLPLTLGAKCTSQRLLFLYRHTGGEFSTVRKQLGGKKNEEGYTGEVRVHGTGATRGQERERRSVLMNLLTPYCRHYDLVYRTCASQGLKLSSCPDWHRCASKSPTLSALTAAKVLLCWLIGEWI